MTNFRLFDKCILFYYDDSRYANEQTDANITVCLPSTLIPIARARYIFHSIHQYRPLSQTYISNFAFLHRHILYRKRNLFQPFYCGSCYQGKIFVEGNSQQSYVLKYTFFTQNCSIIFIGAFDNLFTHFRKNSPGYNG